MMEIKKKKYLPVILSLFCVISCTGIHISGQAPPPSTAKLRVLVITASGPAPKGGWKTPARDVEARIFNHVGSILDKKGIYQVVSSRDIDSAISNRRLTASVWKKENSRLLQELGRAVHAEYAMLFERGFRPGPYLFLSMINIRTEERFEVFTKVKGGGRARNYIPAVRDGYRKLFQAAKKDLLKTAMEKGRQWASGDKKNEALERFQKESRVMTSGTEDSPVQDGPGTAVYDFEAPPHMRIVALILSDALREELLARNMVVVNRENMNHILKEIALGQTGIIPEEQAVKAGKALSARHIIWGRLGRIGKSLMLQTKMIDPEQAQTIGMASVRCRQGMEEKLLTEMPGLVDKLIQ